VHDEKRWTANVKIPLGLGGLKMKIDMNKTDEREPEHASLDIKGNGVGAMLSMQTSFDLAEADGGTAMKWSADVKIAGPVGSMGQRVLQPIVNQQVSHVLAALDREVQASL
jgi:carbon monoxide dehydrogenase subunit G